MPCSASGLRDVVSDGRENTPFRCPNLMSTAWKRALLLTKRSQNLSFCWTSSTAIWCPATSLPDRAQNVPTCTSCAVGFKFCCYALFCWWAKRRCVRWQGKHPVRMCKLNVNCMKNGTSVDKKISEFKLSRHHESFYFMDGTAMKPIQEQCSRNNSLMSGQKISASHTNSFPSERRYWWRNKTAQALQYFPSVLSRDETRYMILHHLKTEAQ